MSEEAALRTAAKETERRRDEIRKQRRQAFEAEQSASRARFDVSEKETVERELLEQRRERQAARAAERQHRLAVSNEPLIP